MPNVILNEQDKQELVNYLANSVKGVIKGAEAELKEKLQKKILNLRHKNNLPSFVKVMIRQIYDLINLLDNPDLNEEDWKKIVGALNYFLLAEDRIPDYIPAVGYLDDAYVISSVHEEFKIELKRNKRSFEA